MGKHHHDWSDHGRCPEATPSQFLIWWLTRSFFVVANPICKFKIQNYGMIFYYLIVYLFIYLYIINR